MKLLVRVAVLVSGVVVGLVAVEGAFRARDHGAFPHLNIYKSDPTLGVRLLPGSTEKISFSHNPVSQVRVNAEGYRGADWPAHADGEILVVGDSQAFGLGVEEDQAFAWKLAAALHRPLANGAVPTYGPAEYDDVLAEELPRRKPKTVVYAINLANDLFEAAHPNSTRHAVWDGWAVRKETAPAQVTSFPGRQWLFRDSHAFFAARGLWFRIDGDTEDGRAASEGGWKDVLSAGHTAAQAHADATRDEQAQRSKREAEIAQALKDRQAVDKDLEQAFFNGADQESFGDELGPKTLLAARANPGDIVRVYYGEGSAPVPLTAEAIAEAAKARKAAEDRFRQRHDDKTLATIARQDALEQRLRALRGPIATALQHRSPLYPHLVRAKQLCDENGAELVIVVLPLDVQVSNDEWAKYHSMSTIDLTQTRVLADDVLAMADELGARGVDAWPVLAAAEPGAFLDGDLHMSPKGHAAVAAAIATALDKPHPSRLPPLPVGRSAVPTPAEWAAAKAPRDAPGVFDSSDLRAAGCTQKAVREWLRLTCKDVELVAKAGSRAQPLIVNSPGWASLTVAMHEGQQLQALFFGARRGALSMIWGVGEDQLELGLYASKAGPKDAAAAAAHAPTPAEKQLCDCHKKVTGAADCALLYGAVEPGCARVYGEECAPLLACARGDERAPPSCLPREHATEVLHRCAADAPVAHAAR